MSELDRRTFVAALAALSIGVIARPASNAAPPLMLARDAPAGIDPSACLVSEKHDGARAFWDGQRPVSLSQRTRGG